MTRGAPQPKPLPSHRADGNAQNDGRQQQDLRIATLLALTAGVAGLLSVGTLQAIIDASLLGPYK